MSDTKPKNFNKLSQLMREHQSNCNQVREKNDKLRRAVVGSVGRATNLMMDSINADVSRVFLNQRVLEQEARELERQAERLNKLSANWIQLLNNFNNSLKELGDIENWSSSIESDMKNIAASLEYVHESATQNAS
mmetsp:Transcript_4925/g.5335  ORF Transcript_4925/g.5335 Transcript_4925/m.5335 type:complete len:135 (-) Transcript_4925:59-463(-)